MTTKRGMAVAILIALMGFMPMVMWPRDARMFYVFLGGLGLALVAGFYAYALWYFSLFIVTNERIRQVTQRGLFKKTVVDLEFDKIESVSFHVPGVIAGMMGYGSLLIQTSVGDMTISQVAGVEKVYNRIQNALKAR